MYNKRMKILRLSEKLTVSSQLEVKDLDELKQNGVQIIVCNRPDNEDNEQTPFAKIAAAAALLNITPINIPFKSDKHTQRDVIAFNKVLQSNKKIHTYCRTGKRSIALWAAASVKTEKYPEKVLKSAKELGVDSLKAIAPYLKN